LLNPSRLLSTICCASGSGCDLELDAKCKCEDNPCMVEQATQRRRRQVAVPQAAIARFARVAASLGPNWHVEADLGSNVIRLFQGGERSPMTQNDKVAPEKNWRL
jgi:hypothetical protein